MSKRAKRHERAFSIATGRRRELRFRLLGHTLVVQTHERIEVVDLATGDPVPVDTWYVPGAGIRVPLGCTCRYFEVRADNGRRLTTYDGLVRARPIG